MKILFFLKPNSFWESETGKLQYSFPGSSFVFDDNPDSGEYTDADVIVGGLIPVSVLARAENLKLVVVPFVGVDHLPLDLLREKGVQVANSHGNSVSVAERALGMILALYGRIVSYHEDLKKGVWHGFWIGRGLEDSWESIYGKSCSIIGAGQIGSALAGMLKAFDCTVTGFKKRKVSAPYPPYDEIVHDFNDAVDKSEIVVNILPLTSETENIFNAPVLNKMDGKVFVNMGRGRTVDEKALFEVLRDGILKGAALDTWFVYPEAGASEGYPSVYPFHELDNVILSPHIAGFTRQAAAGNIRQAFENLASFLEKGCPVNRVDLKSGY